MTFTASPIDGFHRNGWLGFGSEPDSGWLGIRYLEIRQSVTCHQVAAPLARTIGLRLRTVRNCRVRRFSKSVISHPRLDTALFSPEILLGRNALPSSLTIRPLQDQNALKRKNMRCTLPTGWPGIISVVAIVFRPPFPNRLTLRLCPSPRTGTSLHQPQTTPPRNSEERRPV